MLFRQLKWAAFALLIGAGLASCSDDSNPGIPPVTPQYTGTAAYVVNQGNMSNKLPGSIDMLDLGSQSVTSGVFYQVNGQHLGDTPQAGVRYESSLLVPVYGSDCVWVIDAATLQKVAQLKVDDPEAACAAEGYVFAASNDGYVVRFDAKTMVQAGDHLEVGPNPAGMAVSNGTVYVTISDGYNYEGDNPYGNGKKVVAIDAKTFTKKAEYAVGLNPGQLFTNSKGEVYLIARGNYANIQSTVQKIGTDGKVSDCFSGSMMTMSNDTLYVLSIAYDANYKPVTSSIWYDTISGTSGEGFLDNANLPVNPIAIDVNPVNGHIFVCSRKSTSYDAYSQPGCVYEYRGLKEGSLKGAHVHTYDVGVEPYSVAFK